MAKILWQKCFAIFANILQHFANVFSTKLLKTLLDVVTCKINKKALLSQGNRAMPQQIFSV